MRVFRVALLSLLLAGCSGGNNSTPTTTEFDVTVPSPPPASSWPRFGYDAQRSNAYYEETGITAENVGRLKRMQKDFSER